MVLFSFVGNSKTIIKIEKDNISSSNVEDSSLPPRVIGFLIGLISGTGGTYETVTATGAYVNGGCDAKNNNVCSFKRLVIKRMTNVPPGKDFDNVYLNSQVSVETDVFAFDELGGIYLVIDSKSKYGLYKKSHVVSSSVEIPNETLVILNNVIKNINPNAQKFEGINAGFVFKPESHQNGLTYVKIH
jgi:hypothetical protein